MQDTHHYIDTPIRDIATFKLEPTPWWQEILKPDPLPWVQRVISVKELERYLANKWEFVFELKTGDIIIKKPVDVNLIAKAVYAKAEKQVDIEIENQRQTLLKE